MEGVTCRFAANRAILITRGADRLCTSTLIAIYLIAILPWGSWRKRSDRSWNLDANHESRQIPRTRRLRSDADGLSASRKRDMKARFFSSRARRQRSTPFNSAELFYAVNDPRNFYTNVGHLTLHVNNC